MTSLLVADIGGTHSRFALFCSEGKQLLKSINFSTSSYVKFEDMLIDLKSSELFLNPISAAVFAIAGPIVDIENINPPNIPYNISGSKINKILGINKVKLINDFQAQALSILAIDKNRIKVVNQGEKKESYPIAVIGAGTGFGKSLLIKNKDSYTSLASEGGHNDFAPIDEAEYEFAEYAKLRNEKNNLVWDDILSGRGLETLHSFLTGDEVKAPEISKIYLIEETETLRLFSRFYGRAARHYVLDNLALGGLYIAGGVAGKNSLVVNSQSFRASFLDSKYKDILEIVPIKLIETGDSGLIGAAYEAKQL